MTPGANFFGGASGNFLMEKKFLIIFNVKVPSSMAHKSPPVGLVS